MHPKLIDLQRKIRLKSLSDHKQLSQIEWHVRKLELRNFIVRSIDNLESSWLLKIVGGATFGLWIVTPWYVRYIAVHAITTATLIQFIPSLHHARPEHLIATWLSSVTTGLAMEYIWPMFRV